MPEALVLDAIELAQGESLKLQRPQTRLARAMGKRKDVFPLSGADAAAHSRVFEMGRSVVEGAL